MKRQGRWGLLCCALWCLLLVACPQEAQEEEEGEVSRASTCQEGQTRPCPGGSALGQCQVGTQRCVQGAWAVCEGFVAPQEEICDGLDNDCDGQIDESSPAQGQACFEGMGACQRRGVFGCADGGRACLVEGEPVEPTPETCDGVDNDCDGQIDEDFTELGSTCRVGEGDCAGQGVVVCRGDGAGVTCSGLPRNPGPEVCDGVDNDCDGLVDEGLGEDGDQDGWPSGCDNCPGLANPGQEDEDQDGRGDACDLCPQDADNDQDGDGICAAQDNCPSVSNPGQEDSDGDGVGDVCFDGVGCGDLAEENLLLSWAATSQEAAPTALTELSIAQGALVGRRALRCQTEARLGFVLRYEVPGQAVLDASQAQELRMLLRATSDSEPAWQGAAPVVVLEDDQGRQRIYEPTQEVLPATGRWAPIAVPLAGGPLWRVRGSQDAAVSRVRALELRLDSWSQGFTLDVDGVTFARQQESCPLRCPEDCHGRGVCDPQSRQCLCALGASGPQCSGCQEGFVLRDGVCQLEPEGQYDYWPNPVSQANGDPWLAVHHQEISSLRPRVLALHFVNAASPQSAQERVQATMDAMARASQGPQGQRAAQLRYSLVGDQVVDLRDGVLGRPAAPEGWALANSTLYPRRAPEEPGYWRFDYARLFSPEFAQLYGLEGQDLCLLVDSGQVHEVWVLGSSAQPDVNAAGVLEQRQRYDEVGNRLPGSFERCAGEGCLDIDVPRCARSLRVRWLDMEQGPGCDLRAWGQALVSTARRDAVPGLSAVLRPFAALDLGARYGLPFGALQDLRCQEPPCIQWQSPSQVRLTHLGQSYTVRGFDPVCGDPLYPPGAWQPYQYEGVAAAQRSCEWFGRDNRPRVLEPAWLGLDAQAPGCQGAGGFLLWWAGHLPAWGSGQVDPSTGAPMPSVWPYLFY